VASGGSIEKDDDPSSIIRPSAARRIDEILEVATKDRAAAIQKARRFREWLRRQKASKRAHPDTDEILRELDILIDTLRKE
jgi:hypothetical protein